MPPGLRAAYVREVQAGAGPEYALNKRDHVIEAAHPKQDVRVRVEAGRVELAAKNGQAPIALSLAEVGDTPAAAPSVEHDHNRVTLKRDGIDEWYVHGPLGVEQGFTVHKPLASHAELSLTMAVQGGYKVTKAGDDLLWRNGARHLRTSELYAFDATGKALNTSMHADGATLRFNVDTTDARYPIVIDPLWTEEQKLLPTHLDAAYDEFGRAVDISGDTAVIGVPGDDEKATDLGSVYVFVRSAGAWALQQVVVGTQGGGGHDLGVSVSLDGDTFVAGTDAGFAEVFVRNGGVWTSQQRLTRPSDAGYNFGEDVSLDGDTIIVGAWLTDGVTADSGAAYVFTRSGTVWTQQAKLVASDGAADDRFGRAVSVNGDTVVVGARLDDDDGSSSGSAYVFVRGGATWSQQQKLTAPDATPSDYFGHAVSVESDTALIGAYGHDQGSTVSGAAYVFVRSGSSWSLQQELNATDETSGQFGKSVSLSGNTAVVGDASHGGSEGAAYVFVRSGTTWTEQDVLIAADRSPGDYNDWLGGAVAVDGDVIVAGAKADEVHGTWSGSAYLFERSGGAWNQADKVGPTDDAAGDNFGRAVSIEGDTAIVGAPYDSSEGSQAGSAYVFVRSAGGWSLQQRLVAGSSRDYFGSSVSLSGDTAVIGANFDYPGGSAYVFVRNGATWSEQQKLTASDAASSDYFGRSVSLDGDTLVVGADGDDDAGSRSGSAYVFTRSGSTWTEQQKLSASDGAASDYFGSGVSVDGDTAIVGAYRDDDVGSDSGSAYVFVRAGSTWTEQQKLTASDGAAFDYFGHSVSVSGDTALVGSHGDDDVGTSSGSAYVYVRSGSIWTEQQKLTASDGAASDYFGSSVAVSDDTAIVGAYDDNQGGINDVGAAYVFVRNGSTWTEQQKLSASDGAEDDYFGYSVAVGGTTAIVGAHGSDDEGTNSGAAYMFKLEDQVLCGNGMVDSGEQCDSGANNSDTIPNRCRTTCQSPSCGDGVTDSGEQCDDGASNSDGVANACRTSCMDAFCGDGVIDNSESCDDGMANSNSASNACRTSCEPASCGDGVIDDGESCDDGVNNSDTIPGACRTTCVLPSCGDGMLDAGEECDNGGANSDSAANACRTSCVTAYCGDAVVDSGESCDDGEANSDVMSNACRTDCGVAYCGDGVMDSGEQCDEGEFNSDTEPQSCRTSCQYPGCGDGVVDDLLEDCDDGERNSNTEPDACRSYCVAAFCGDGVVDSGEHCDDGENNSDTVRGACSTSCRTSACGDGWLDSGEACDDGNRESGDGCTSQCNLEAGYRCIDEPSYCTRNGTPITPGGKSGGGCTVAMRHSNDAPMFVLLLFGVVALSRRRLL